MPYFEPGDFVDKVAVVTGGSGVLCSRMAETLAELGSKVVILNRRLESGQRVAKAIVAGGGEALALSADVTDITSLQRAADQVVTRYGGVDFLVNGAGAILSEGTTVGGRSFFELPDGVLLDTVDVNLIGAMRASQVFGKLMVERGGSIVNISSLASGRALTHVVAYSAAKAGLDNFTRWLAVYMARTQSSLVRVNAVAPGFILTDVNRNLLLDESRGELSDRGRSIVSHTPMGRLGQAEDLIGAVTWLLSSSAAFVTGVVIPVDGGVSAFSGI